MEKGDAHYAGDASMVAPEDPQMPSMPLPPDAEGDTHSARKLGPHHHDDYFHRKALKMGFERLPRRPAAGYLSLPKKEGHGGKFTWEGPAEQPNSEENCPVAIDEGDPNYVDAKDEALDADRVVGFVDVAKVAETPGVARVAVVVEPEAQAQPQPQAQGN